MNQLLVMFLFVVVFNIGMFLPAYIYKTDKLTDISYALSFIVLILFSLLKSSFTNLHVLLALLITCWAVRLGGFLLMRVVKKGKDARFDGMRENAMKFFRFWLFQGITVFIVLLGALEFMDVRAPVFNIISCVGLVVFLGGLIIEAKADLEKWNFSKDHNNKGLWIESGLWSRSRHPNYIGEIMVWAGIYFFILPSLYGLQWLIALLSPAYIIILLIYVSGIPILEKSADKKWGSNKNYIAYKKRVPLLLSWKKR